MEAGHHIALVVTQPDRLGGRGMRPLASPVKATALELGLPLDQPERIKDPVAQSRIRAARADLMVVVAYGQILPSSLITAPRLGTINVHASLLPRHRGPAPIEWAILSDDPETGVTTMQMDAGVDTGPILEQERVPIGPQETAAELENRLAELGGRLLVRTLEDLDRGRIRPTAQSEPDATHARRLRSEDGKLEPGTMSAEEIDRRVRALGERVGTWMRLDDVELKVLRGHLGDSPGDGVPVATARGIYVLDEVQPAGGRRMSAAAWMRGRR